MARTLPAITGALIVGLIAGFAIGYARRPPRPSNGASTPPPRETPQGVLPATEKRADDLAALQEVAARQRAEIETLVGRVGKLSRQLESAHAVPDKTAPAKEILELWIAAVRNAKSGSDPAGWMRVIHRLAELDETMAPVFLEEVRRRKGEERDPVLRLAVSCGGKEVAEFLKGELRNPALSQEERDHLLATLPILEFLPEPRPLPMDPDLVQTAFRLAGSSRMPERTGGVGLLSRYADPTSQEKPQELAASDPEIVIRSMAIQALGRIGDRTALEYLMKYPPPAEGQALLKLSVTSAIAKLKKKFPD